jgi:hypothetical protein
MPANPHVAIVILNYNGLEYLQKYLPGVLQSHYETNRFILLTTLPMIYHYHGLR